MKNLGFLLTVLIFVGCAKEAPYEEIKTPDQQIIAKDSVILGIQEPNNGITNDQLAENLPVMEAQLAKLNEQKRKLSTQVQKLNSNTNTNSNGISQDVIALQESIKVVDEQIIQLNEELKPYKEKLEARNTEYLYLVSTLGAPREVASQAPFFQGEEKIVKFRYEEDGLKLYESEKDLRFNDNPLNSSPVLTIPGEYVEYRCKTNDQGDCLNKEEENKDISWKQKSLFKPDFDKLEVHETNEVNLFANNDFCFSEIKKKAVSVEVTREIVNIEVEKTYQLQDSWLCKVINFLDNDQQLANTSFKVRYFYSIAKLNSLASKGYQSVDYPLQDHNDFGFFTNKIKRLGNNFDPNRPEISYKLNRFNPDKKVIDYHLSATFNKKENLYLRDATYKAIESINQSFARANTDLRINLINAPSAKEEKKSGDLRYNTIVLIDEPLANGLLGYGPSVSHPRTGEILQAHTNMYSGVLRTGVRRSYHSMVLLSQEELKKKKAAAATTTKNNQKPSQQLNTQANSRARVSVNNNIDLDRKIKLETKFLQSVNHNELANIHYNHSRAKAANERLLHAKMDFLDHAKLADHRKGIKGIELKYDQDFKNVDRHDVINMHSENNAYHIEMFNFNALAKEIMPGVKEIPGILEADGTLKSWDDLSESVQEKVSKIIMVNTYSATLVHEIGHNLGLRHNFMGSTDHDNFYSDEEATKLGLNHIPQYSSIMDYAYSDLNELSVLGKYDIAALRYAYAREVELIDANGDSQFSPVGQSLNDLKTTLDSTGLKVKNYNYCTDENAGLSVLCNRFDEGTNVKEIAQHYSDSYIARYDRLNWRDGRTNFSTYDIIDYVSYNMGQFRRMRKVYEMFELYQGFFGAEFMEEGCSDDLLKDPQYTEVCTDINQIRDGALIAGNFFLDILKTPDVTCAAISAMNPTQTQYLSLAEIFEEAKWRLNLVDVPKTCFDPAIMSYLADPQNMFQMPFVVTGEAGRYLNSIKDPDPRYPYASDIRVRGVWTDKMLAMRYLTTRIDENVSSDAKKGSLADISSIRLKLDNLLDHMVLGKRLADPIKFRRADGSEYIEDHFELSGTNYKVAESPYQQLARYFGLPTSGSQTLNGALIANAVWYTETDDFDTQDQAETFVDSLSVFKTMKTTVIDPNKQKEFIVGKYKYVAQEEHRVANELVAAKTNLDVLKFVDKASAEKVFEARTTLPAGLDTDTMIVLTSFRVETIQGFIIQLSDPNAVIPDPKDLSPDLAAVVRLGVKGLQDALQVLDDMNKAPADATDQEQLAYASELDVLNEYINGDLERRVSTFKQSIELLYPL